MCTITDHAHVHKFSIDELYDSILSYFVQFSLKYGCTSIYITDFIHTHMHTHYTHTAAEVLC